MTAPTSRICCLDLDTFFVSVERLLDPSLMGKAVVVGAMPGKRGVVTACSYEVREFGVHSGMAVAEAYRLAPHAIFLPGQFGKYSPYAKEVKVILERFCPVVRTASIDEFFLDFRGCEALYKKPGDSDRDATIERVVREMRQAIQDEVGLPASAGIGPTRNIAKMASGRAKPAGVKMVRIGEELAFVEPLPVRKYPGIGPVTEARLLEHEIETLSDLLNLPPGPLRARFGSLSESVRRGVLAHTLTKLPERDRPAFHEHDPQGVTAGSISNERTFSADIGDTLTVENQLRSLCERVCWRARNRDINARTVTLRLRWSDFRTITRSRTIPPTHNERHVFACIKELFRAANSRKLRIRLVGVGLSNLVGPNHQLLLPFAEPNRPQVGRALDAVRDRYGYDAIRLGVAGGSSSWLA